MAESRFIKNQPLYIGTSALDLNSNNFYETVLDSYKKIKENETETAIEVLPTQSNIRMIQQVYLDMANSDEKLSIAGVPVSFVDDVWDFTSLNKAGKPISTYTYDFTDKSVLFTDYQNILMKLFVFYLITEYGIHSGTNKGKFSETKKLFVYMNKHDILLVDHISLSDYKEFYAQSRSKYTTVIKRRRLLREFLEFYSTIANNVLTKELNDWFLDIETDKVNADIEQNKTVLLPTSFYNKYSAGLYDSVFNQDLPKYKRGYYGLLYIGTQTGLRAGELAILQVQDLEVISFKKKTIGILHYRSTKTGNGKNKVYDQGTTNANQKVIAVYEALEVLFQPERQQLQTDLLVPKNMNVAPNGTDLTKTKHFRPTKLLEESIIFCLEHKDELGVLNAKDADSFEGLIEYHPNQKKRTFLNNKLAQKNGLKDGDRLSYPLIRQFRVYVASEYRERGVDDRTTAYLFNHHSVEMYGYYARPKHEVQEDIDFSREIIKDIVEDKTKILGPKGDALTDKINGIIEDNNFNVEKDLDAIIEKVCNEVPIRAKNGGFCMKSNPRRECRHDAKTDEFLCAYGCCPNHCHMYFMLPITYDKVASLKKTYDYNIQAGFENASQKEARKFNAVYTKEFLPELNETKNEMTRLPEEEIVKRHPEMKSILPKIEEIEKEVYEWNRAIEKSLSTVPSEAT